MNCMDVKECLEKKLLKKDTPDRRKALRSLEIALKKLEKAKKLHSANFFEEAVVSAYSSMFHAARAVLYKDGFKEKSHYALYVYLNEKYGGKIEKKLLIQFDYLRQERHDVMYALEETKLANEEVNAAISISRDFIEAIRKLV